MCDHCRILPVVGARRHFLRQLAGGAAAVAVGWPAAMRGAETAPLVKRGGWARLVVPNFNWNFHGREEQQFIAFLQSQSGLPNAVYGAQVSADKVEDLSAYGVLFTNDLTSVQDRRSLDHLREYLLRGGFIYVDDCVHVTPDFAGFEHDHLALFPVLVPGCQILRLGPRHPIYSCHFRVNPAELWDDHKGPEAEINALYGVYDDDRMVGLISMAHFFCGWNQSPETIPNKLRMLTNIYTYAVKS